MTRAHLPAGLAVVPIGSIQPCPIQPRVNVSVELVAKLSGSMKAGRHNPVLEVEPAPGQRGRYQIVCGEQRWRAAQAAGLAEVLVRLHPRFGYLERLEKQYEENRLRASLDVVEEAHCILLDKTIRDIAVAEQLLRDSLVPFQPLDDKGILQRAEFAEHLDDLRRLLVKHKTHTVRTAQGKVVAGPLSPWRQTEQALGISESQRKAKLTVLRLDPELLEEVRDMPAEHVIQICRLQDPDLQAQLVERARDLTHRQVHSIVDRLLLDPDATVEQLVAEEEVHSIHRDQGPLLFGDQLVVLADLCRQLARSLSNLRPRLLEEERAQVLDLLGGLRHELDAFEEAV